MAEILVDIAGGYGTTVPPVKPLSTDAKLNGLAITPSSVTLSPSFAAATTAYTASVSNSFASLRVTPTVNQANATVTVNGTTLASGQQSSRINLSVGSNTITVVVTAQDGTTTKIYTLTVTRAAAPSPVSNAPAANAGADQTVDTGATVTLQGSGSDPNTGDTLTYRWTQVSGTTVALSSATAARPTFTGPSSAASLVFRLTVSDSALSDNDEVTITVQQALDFSALPGYGQPLDFLDNCYGSTHTLTDFSGLTLGAVSTFVGTDTETQRGIFGIHGPVIPNIVGSSAIGTPFFSMWVREYSITSSNGVVRWRK